MVDSSSAGSYVVFDALRFVNTANVKITDEQSQQVFPTDLILHPAYPNPFNTSTVLNYELFASSVVKIDIFNILGDRVKTVLNEKQAPGFKTIIWDGTNDRNKTVPTGIYYCTVSTNRFSEINKMVLIK
ncbi:MAG TPA: T9SS type A sorting domain-containing protein [Candidatus Marinimicrobia bacterium]|nr:T9SS type A sorting domain-containing protein [Candidatus Neomarinimicrobiota bacterium]